MVGTAGDWMWNHWYLGHEKGLHNHCTVSPAWECIDVRKRNKLSIIQRTSCFDLYPPGRSFSASLPQSFTRTLRLHRATTPSELFVSFQRVKEWQEEQHHRTASLKPLVMLPCSIWWGWGRGGGHRWELEHHRGTRDVGIKFRTSYMEVQLFSHCPTSWSLCQTFKAKCPRPEYLKCLVPLVLIDLSLPDKELEVKSSILLFWDGTRAWLLRSAQAWSSSV